MRGLLCRVELCRIEQARNHSSRRADKVQKIKSFFFTYAKGHLLKFHQFYSAKKYPKGYAQDSKITFLPAGINNQSHMCGKRVGLGFFPSDSLESQSYEFIEIAHIGPYYGVEWL